MLLSALSFLVVAQSSSEVPEGLMNNPVHVLSDVPSALKTYAAVPLRPIVVKIASASI